MSGSSVLWAEAPDDDDGAEQAPESEAHGDVDESFAARRLRRWIRGMFGGGEKRPAAEPEEPGREPEP
jgi:hypothetical protein